MRQLTGLDASFLYLETDNCPMHIGGLAIYDPSTSDGGAVGYKQILANVLQRAHRVAAMNEVLVEVPLRLDHPYWRSDGVFDPEFHIRHISLPKPGDWRQLCIQVSRLHSRPLDRARPLWEFYVIEGLDNVEGFPPGCFAVLSKMHHAAIDGASGVEVAAAIHDLSPDYNSIKDKKDVKKERKPSSAKLILNAQLNTIKTPLRVLDVAKNTIPGVAKMMAGLARGKLSRVTDIPRTRFNTNEILVSLMLVYVAGMVLSYMIHGPWRDPDGYGFPQSILFSESAILPIIIEGTRAHAGVFVTVLALLLTAVFFRWSLLAFQMKVAGLAPKAADYAGFDNKRMIWIGLLAGGAAAGLAGTSEVAGPIGQLTSPISPGYGFAAIIVAFVGRLHPVGILLASLLMSLLYLGGESAQMHLSLPSAVSGVFQGLLLFFLLATDVLINFRIVWNGKQNNVPLSAKTEGESV